MVTTNYQTQQIDNLNREIEQLKEKNQKEIKNTNCQHPASGNHNKENPTFAEKVSQGINIKTPQNTNNTSNPANRDIKTHQPPHPPINISPGEGQLAEPGTIPMVSYAKVIGRRRKPKVVVPQEVIDQHPEFAYTEENENEEKEKISEEDIENFKKKFRKIIKNNWNKTHYQS